ncbi:uncharacterized protein LOC111876767 isoform X1 [Lactuca sativa]|uniref:uncharacterized protein LOC111876767 isoform X1 n=1 Tax=Lactuca sativa TaxID=4236 RepID=UPI001C693C48|nr:uncharacterized protein LOC111876767 isoform X1 [Lactuca sativa]
MRVPTTGVGKATSSAAATELSTKSDAAFDLTHLDLPFQLIKSETIPPAPTRTESAIDWLPDYLGHAWIAYAASSLLVISHFPSPSENNESPVDPFFRQVIELSSDGSGDVSAVSWSPSVLSSGEVAASSDNRIGVFSHNSEGSFCWSQTAILVQATNIKAIKWTGSGDGLISVGIDIVLWKKKNLSWEISWKFTPEFPQALLSATSSIEGPFATAPLNKDTNNSVLIGHGKSKCIKSELHHHVPISMIQWRPLVANHWKKKPTNALKMVLLTCCADGTVRLWSEIDDGKSRKTTGKGNKDQSSFRVAATIEINETLNGILGCDVFIRWATELDGIVNIGKKGTPYFPSEEYHHGKSGKCDWLISFGPQMMVTFWAIHCIDDFSPLRFPRVTMWKKQELPGSKTGTSFLLNKSFISRNGFFGPPDVCSVIHLLPNNHLKWLQFHKHTSNTTDSILSIANGALNINGHTGKILQIALHPYGGYPELAVSLDANGVILFWSFLSSGFKLSGEFVVQDSPCEYTSLRWAPSLIDDHRVLLMGHSRGIDCFLVEVCEKEDLISCQKLCTIPFDCDENGPTSIFSIPLTSTCNTFLYNKFMVIAIWKEKDHFQALSWKVTIHPSDTPGGECKYSIDFDRCSSTFPDPYNHDNITSYSVVGMYNFSSSKEQEKSFVGEMFDNSVAYHIITGSFDGSLKLWRSMDQEWELVGKIAAHVGPIMKINSTDCGRKIATLSNENTIYIWECVYLGGIGSFLLEDTINLDGGGVVVGFDWLTIGNGQLLLGVCLQNEVHVYTMRRCVSSEESKDGNENRNIWFCVAKRQTRPCIRDFVWGPKATGVIVHDDYFCLFSQWVLPNGGSDGFKVPEIIYDSDTHAFENLKLKDQQKYNNTNNTGIGVRSVLEIAENVGGSLPTYHPEALLVNIYSGNWKRAQSALSHLFQHLTNNKDLKTNPRIPQMSLSDYLEGLILKNSNSKAFKWSGDTYSNTSTWDPNSNDFSNSIDSSPKNSGLSGFTDSIEKLHDLSDIEKMQILAVIDLLDEISNSNTSSPYEGLDIPGRRFWVAVRFQQLYCVRRLGRPPSKGDLVINSSLIAWAFQSDCQESLFESLLNNDSSWDEMRTMGVGFWYTNQAQLRVKMERLAKQQFLKNRDPKACALLYIALNRIQVLAGLFKISKDEKDKPLVAFLSRNFQEEKNKAAALKNAYVLMGRHQLELAVAFFLLGGDTASAINVCAKTLKDEQLALVICRLLEGYNGPSEHYITSKFLLPSAYENGDYWKSSFLEWILGNYYKSYLSLIGDQMDFSSNNLAFIDPSIGQYCQMLTNKNQMKNAIGEQNTSILVRWGVLMSSTALSRCGLPLEALECLATSNSIFSGSTQSALDNSESKILNERLNPSSSSSNWVSADVALRMLSHAKYSFAMQYISNMLTEHPSWPENIQTEAIQYNTQLSNFGKKLNTGLAYFEQKYSLNRHHLINMITGYLYNQDLMFIACDILQHDTSEDISHRNPCYPSLPAVLLKSIKDFSYLFSRYIIFCRMTCSETKLHSIYMKNLLLMVSKIRNGLKLQSFPQSPLFVLDLCEYYIYFASIWFQKDSTSLIIVLKQILLRYSNESSSSSSYGSNMETLKKILPEIAMLVCHNKMNVGPESDKWQIIRAFLWGLMSGFLKYQIDSIPENLEDKYSVELTRLLKLESEDSISYCAKELASFLLRKGRDQSNEPIIFWLEDLCRSTPITTFQNFGQGVDFSRIMSNEDGLSGFEVLWNVFDNHRMLCGDFVVEYSKWSKLIKQKHSKGWSDTYADIIGDHEASENDNQDGISSPVTEFTIPFQKPKEVQKANGELLEALCINSIDQQQAAIASNKKGIIFFNFEDGRTCFDKSNYIWTDVDWPTDGWAGSESTPVPTCVSPGIGLGSRKGTQLGLGGATIGVGLAKPGITGVNTSSLGWEIQEDFEDFIDPPATVDNIRTRAFSSHPSRPFFLVGSSNTHVYLWEFGKNTATATYGVLPAANVPPPYALASISAVQFDHCGQRFATAALDGTVCTWQLEVGGRSNVRPTESSLCFNNYTSDVMYVTASGSIVAAAGYSSNNVNVVIWDTLAPPTTSRASIMCHEGGARSISVFANDIGSGSISPLIVTGGKGGDIGVHDFRYIATGRQKRNKNSDNVEQKFNASSTAGLQNKHGDHNRNGMLWYIPKAHSGSVTRIAAVPNTSFFLSGSKDGDVKLWDAKNAKLVYHWPKLHDRHTFLQPTSRGFGGVVRFETLQAAVTDIQVVSNGFLSCGGDGSVKLVQLRDL